MRTWTSAVTCLLAAGCVSTTVQRLDETPRPARAPEVVTVLTGAPTQPYTVIAVIESKGASAFDSFDDLRAEMVAEAAKLGGEAVILGDEVSETDFILTGTAMIPSEEKRMRCQVIVFGVG